MDEHQLISALKNLAAELGQTPTEIQFTKHAGKGSHRYRCLFGGWNLFINAAGLAPNRYSQKKKINDSIFQKNIETHLEEYVPRETIVRSTYPSIAIISDIHWPFENKKVIDSFLDFVGDLKPQYIFLNGDAWDMYAHSKFPRSLNIYTPRDEENLSRQKNEVFWKECLKRSPKSKCIQKTGNHDFRPMKRVLESYPEAEDWITERLKKMFSFDGVESDMDPRNETIIGDIAVFHGYLSQLGGHRDYTMYNSIVGHTHKGGTVFKQIRGQTLWELNSGLAGDPESKGLSYTPQKITTWTPGFGAVDKMGPRFISL